MIVLQTGKLFFMHNCALNYCSSRAAINNIEIIRGSRESIIIIIRRNLGTSPPNPPAPTAPARWSMWVTTTCAAPGRCFSYRQEKLSGGKLFVAPRKTIRYCVNIVLDSLNQEKRVTFALYSAAAFKTVPYFPNDTSNHCSGKGITTIQ